MMKSQRAGSEGNHKSGAVRYIEKRRVGTCRFADRVASISMEVFQSKIPQCFREKHKYTCAASVVAHFENDDHLQVVALGVGTKFLHESVLRAEELDSDSGPMMEGADGNNRYKGYGIRVRDCHAEVLARRAFRRQLSFEMQELLGQHPVRCSSGHRMILKQTQQRSAKKGTKATFTLEPGVTLHFYSSSAPCGNAALKKFSKMEGEHSFHDLAVDEWPSAQHDPILGHARSMGQFALLVKRDNTVDEIARPQKCSTTRKGWPALQSDEWCPIGTSIVGYNKGSIHSCSDKLCRWNIMGLQGSLLSSLLDEPIFMDTITIGRKFTPCISRRAICCRAREMPKKRSRLLDTNNHDEHSVYRLHHPAIMGTGIYMDDSGTLDMTNNSKFGQDVHFDSQLSWAWWPGLSFNHEQMEVECIDGSTGFAYVWDNTSCGTVLESAKVSRISSASLLNVFATITGTDVANVETTTSLASLRAFKLKTSVLYESEKTKLMTNHIMFRQWRRRENEARRSCQN